MSSVAGTPTTPGQLARYMLELDRRAASDAAPTATAAVEQERSKLAAAMGAVIQTPVQAAEFANEIKTVEAQGAFQRFAPSLKDLSVEFKQLLQEGFEMARAGFNPATGTARTLKASSGSGTLGTHQAGGFLAQLQAAGTGNSDRVVDIPQGDLNALESPTADEAFRAAVRGTFKSMERVSDVTQTETYQAFIANVEEHKAAIQQAERERAEFAKRPDVKKEDVELYDANVRDAKAAVTFAQGAVKQLESMPQVTGILTTVEGIGRPISFNLDTKAGQLANRVWHVVTGQGDAGFSPEQVAAIKQDWQSVSQTPEQVQKLKDAVAQITALSKTVGLRDGSTADLAPGVDDLMKAIGDTPAGQGIHPSKVNDAMAALHDVMIAQGVEPTAEMRAAAAARDAARGGAPADDADPASFSQSGAGARVRQDASGRTKRTAPPMPEPPAAGDTGIRVNSGDMVTKLSEARRHQLERIGESDLLQAIDSSHIQQQGLHMRSQSRLMALQAAIMSPGMSIEAILVMFMSLLTENELDKLRLKMQEITVAEQFERANRKVEANQNYARDVIRSFRENEARDKNYKFPHGDYKQYEAMAGLIPAKKREPGVAEAMHAEGARLRAARDAGDPEALKWKEADIKELESATEIERAESFQDLKLNPGDFGFTQKQSQTLQQELQFQLQNYKQVMEAFTAVIRMLQDIVARIVQNIR